MPRSSPIAALPDIHQLAATGPTIAECRERYRRWLRAQNLRPATIGIYSSALDEFERFLIEKGMPQTLRAIRREHVEEWVEWLQRRPGRKGATASQSWVSLSFRGLQPFWKWAIDRDEIDASPMERMKRPVVDEVVKPSLTFDQLDALLKTTKGRTYENRRDRAILLTLLDTGMRRGELAGLRVQDIDFATATIHIPAAVSKSRRDRVIGIDAETVEALDAYLSVRERHPLAGRTDALWLGVRRGPGGKRKRPVDPDDIDIDMVPPHGMKGDGFRQLIDRRARQAGIPGSIGVHIFRRTMADVAYRSGATTEELMVHGGWRDRGMPAYYARALAEDRTQQAHRRWSPVRALLSREPRR